MSEIDWRYKATARVAKDTQLPGGGIARKGELLKVSSVIQLNRKKQLTIPMPEVVALYISAAKKSWDSSSKIRADSKIDKTTKSDVTFAEDELAFDALESVASAVILSYSAIEAFCNDSIPDDHEYWHEKKSQLILEKSSKEEIERYFSTASKLNDVLPGIFGSKNPKGKSPIWDSFLKLKKCRDGLIHAKSKEVRPLYNSPKNLWSDLFKIRAPHLLAKNVFDWFLKDAEIKPYWYQHYPN